MNGNFGVMDSGYFVSKGEIFKWVETMLGKQIKSIEHLGNGNIYCELINRHFGKELIAGIIFSARLQHEYIHNLRLFQKGLDKLKIEKKLDILKLAKCKYLDNLEIIQWLKRFLETYEERHSYTEFTTTTKLNSPRLMTSPNLKKKIQGCLSPKRITSPRISRFSSSSNPLSTVSAKQQEKPTSPNSNSKLHDIKNLLNNHTKSQKQKLLIIKSLISPQHLKDSFQNQPINEIDPLQEENDVL